MEAVHVTNISKTYGSVKALQNVSFQVNEGELFGIIGPDGAGKTTLFRILCTLLSPESGEAVVQGFNTVGQMRDIRNIVGYMPGRFSLYQDLTVEENLNFFATIFGTTVEQGYESIKAVYSQIERFKNRKAGALSGGMKQKLALSCALVHQPKVLFLDEPTTGVDPVSRKEFWQMLRALKQRGITILVSTPYLDEVRQCERVAFLNEGKLMGVGTPEDILNEFAHIFNPPPVQRESAEEKTEEHVIEVRHLVKAFGNFRAVDDISFFVKKGEIFGFLGANGVGKTTAMHMLTGLNQPTEGEVAENIRLFGGIYGMDNNEIKRKTDEVLNKLHFQEHKDSIVASLPLGWKQKLAFTVSIFHQPEVVFLDEPTGGVDPATRRQFWELIYDATEQGITVFVTTHYMDEAEYCDRLSIMVDGKIKAMGTPEELKEKFQQPDIDHVFTLLARQAERADN